MLIVGTYEFKCGKDAPRNGKGLQNDNQNFLENLRRPVPSLDLDTPKKLQRISKNNLKDY
jgi:hypothetical protein